jgi:hypothetical protein
MELMLRLPTITLTVVLLTLTWIVSFRRNSLLRSGGMNRRGATLVRGADSRAPITCDGPSPSLDYPHHSMEL